MTSMMAIVCQSLCDWPAQFDDASMQSALRQSDSSCPDGQRKGYALVREQSRAARVPALFGSCGPVDVAWFVVAIVVGAIQGVQGRGPRSNIAQEGFERVMPCRTDCDTASPVVVEIARSRIVAAVLHRGPRLMFRRIRQAVSRVARTGGSQHIQPMTATGPRVPISQVGAPNRDDGLAIALAEKVSAAAIRVRETQYRESPEACSRRNFNRLGHEVIVPRNARVEAQP